MISYGFFVNTAISFLIVAFAFIPLMKRINRLQNESGKILHRNHGHERMSFLRINHADYGHLLSELYLRTA